MIVSSIMDQAQTDPQPPVSQISTTGSTVQVSCNQNYYLKRKHRDLNDSLDDCNYIQPKKRHIFHQQQQQQQHQFTVADENYTNLANCQAQNDAQHYDLQFNINNNNFLNCHTIEFLSYDSNLQPVSTETTVYNATPITNNSEHFDSNQWQNSDLLELDQRYNSVSQRFDKVHNSNEIHRNDEIIYHNQQHQQQNQHQNDDTIQHLTTHHHQKINPSQTFQNQEHQQHQQEQHNLISNSIDLQIDNHLNTSSQDQVDLLLGNKSTTKNDQEADFEDKNLSWLFNFRLDELPHLSPDVQINQKSSVPLSNNIINTSQQNKPVNNIKTYQSKTGKKVDELIKELTAEITDDSDMLVGDNVIVENMLSPPRGPKKPPFTYTELIEYALEERGELTVSGIYQWISDRFPYYKSNDDRWKNSVRHNLSINPHFRKGLKAPQGAGHLWTISSRDSEENVLAWEHKKQRLELFFKMEQLHSQRQQSTSSNNQEQSINDKQNYLLTDETSIAVQHLSHQMQQNSSSSPVDHQLNLNVTQLNENMPSTSCLPLQILENGNELKQSAGEILNGVRRTVEVQPINCREISTYHDNILETDYLNPIKHVNDIMTNEGGFHSEFYVTEIDPIELGINITNVEEEVLFSEEFNLNYFGITSANDIVA